MKGLSPGLPSSPTDLLTDDSSDAAALGHQYEVLFGAESIDLGNGHRAVLLPPGRTPTSLKKLADEYATKPDRREGSAVLRDAESFVAHVLRFKSEESAVFASPDRAKPSLLAVFDYHPRGGDATKADFAKHRALYECPLSEEWKAWQQHDGKLMPQVEFAEFIENRAADVVVAPPDDTNLRELSELLEGAFASPSRLLTLSRGLQINVEATVKDAVTLSSGEISVQYSETHVDGAGQPIKVPNLFVIQIPVFYAGEPWRIPVRLRYRRNSGRLLWSYHLYRADATFDAAFKEVVGRVRAATEVPVFLGAPEA